MKTDSIPCLPYRASPARIFIAAGILLGVAAGLQPVEASCTTARLVTSATVSAQSYLFTPGGTAAGGLHPFTSFSHTHGELDHLPGLRLHPVDHESDHLPTHDDDGHHHHSLDQYIDWHMFRPTSKRLKTLSNLCCLCTGAICDFDVVQSPATRISEKTVYPESIPITAIVPRGPPALG